MPVSEGYISEPIGLKSVADFFGTAYDVAAVCTSSIINKWSKRKPTGISPTSPATPSSTHDTANGYWWAVKLESTKPTGIHTHAFDYKKPGASDFKRLAEFNGYKHAASPNFDVSCGMTPKSADADGDTLNANLVYDTFATFPIPSAEQYGIDYITVFQNALGLISSDPLTIFQNVYPVCVVDGWMCVMPYYALAPASGIRTKALSDGSKWYRFFLLDLKSLNETVTGGLTTGEHTFTLGVIVRHNGTNAPDYSGVWQQVKDTWADEIFPMRSFVGKVFRVLVPQTAPPATLSISGGTSSGFDYSHTFRTSTADIPLRVRVSMRCNLGTSQVTVTYDANPKDQFSLIRTATWADFGIAAPVVGTRYTVTGTIQTSVDGETWVGGTGASFTVTYAG